MKILVIPAYNEAAAIQKVVKQAENYVDRIVVIDDGSGDETFNEAKKAGGAIVLRHKINLGKGAALKTGCLAAVRLGADIIITIDSDGQHPPEHIPEMLRKMKENNWQVVFSVRRGGDKMPLIRFLGNYALNKTARLLFNINLRDMWCGFRAVRADCLPLINWRESDYSGEVQMALKVGARGLAYGEHIIPTVYKDEFKGVTIINGLKLLAQMFIWRIRL